MYWKKYIDKCVSFESHLFEPFLSEEGQVNPRVYGAELAWWLSRELLRKVSKPTTQIAKIGAGLSSFQLMTMNTGFVVEM